jgi:prolipoprotein diacylglyceryl transferase
MNLAYITWDVKPELFHLGNFPVGWYGLLFALGFLIGQRIMVHIFRAEGVKEELVDSLTLYMVLATVIGARVGHYLFYETPLLLQSPGKWLWEMLVPPYRGLASHGATIGIITGLYLFARRQKMNFFWIADRVVITVALAGCFIRFGNLMNSEILGIPTTVPWAFLFVQDPEYLRGVYPLEPRHPAQLYESLSCLVLFFLLFALWRRYKTALPQGTITGIFLIWVFGLRFVWEFFKENQVAFEDSMTLNMGQWLSIPAVLFGIVGVWYALKKHQTSIWRDDHLASVSSAKADGKAGKSVRD